MCGLLVAATPARAAAQPAQELRIVVLEGEDSVNIIEQGTAVPTLVEVRDRNDLPVSGASVTFLLGEGGTATLNAGLSQVAATTNALGQAAVTVNPLASGAVQLQVTAAFQGQTATAAIVQTNFATLAEAAAAGAGATGGAGGGGGGTSAAGGAAGGAGGGPGGGGAGGAAAAGAGGGLGAGAIVGLAAAGAGAAVGGVTLSGSEDDDGAGPGGGGNGGGVIGGTSPNTAPVAMLTVAPDALGMAGLTRYRFDGRGSTDPDGDALTYSWDFGDGSEGIGPTATHVYDARGRYTVTLTVNDGRDSATASGSVRVGPNLTGRFEGTFSPDDDPVDFSSDLRQTGRNVRGTLVVTERNRGGPSAYVTRGRIRGEFGSSDDSICPCRVQMTWTVTTSNIPDRDFGMHELDGNVRRGANVIEIRFATGARVILRRQD